MGLLDVNALVALAWDSHVHHVAIRSWMGANARSGWATCSATENGFVRVSANPKVLPSPIAVGTARDVLSALQAVDGHSFITDDVSPCDRDFPPVHGYRQVTDAHLLTLARRQGIRVVTFDTAFSSLGGSDVELLSAM